MNIFDDYEFMSEKKVKEHLASKPSLNAYLQGQGIPHLGMRLFFLRNWFDGLFRIILETPFSFKELGTYRFWYYAELQLPLKTVWEGDRIKDFQLGATKAEDYLALVQYVAPSKGKIKCVITEDNDLAISAVKREP